ncbi:MAG TPA: ATP synthase subunit I [Rudaea sp.]|jgi:ATP synthase protein I|uniref:ATP synthase subunit I n=1 Tax=Rudaea sp. TaxID=2136325 RepID=UPI002F91FBAE
MIRVQANDASLAWALCAGQAITTALATLVAWVVADKAASLAALFGGIVVIVPTAYFAAKIYLRRGGSQAAEILGTFYRAELGKLLLTALLFLVGALLFGKHFAPLILTSMACLAVNWLMLAVAVND